MGDAARKGRGLVSRAVLPVVVFAAVFLYRFNTLGGALGGFSNDEFGYLARARQIQGGDVPFRDFNDPGWFLTDCLSAAAQWLGGYNLRSEALLTIGMLAFGAALTFLLARRLSGSVFAALIGVWLQVAFEPRHYNYPKIVLYAAGLALAWAYADRPSRGRLGTLAALVGVAFLFRHDHLLYLGALALLTVVLVHRASVRDCVRAVAGLGAVVAACIGPFLIFLALSGGVGEYFRSALVYIRRDAERTSFSFPHLSLDFSKPLAAITRATPSGEVRINVRWGPIADEQRADRESRYRLTKGEPRDAATWSYELQDDSRANIEALVTDPLVSDTHGLDRSRFRVEGQSLHLESQLDTVENATAYLYYFLAILPVIAAIILQRLRHGVVPRRVLVDGPYIGPLLVLAVMVNVGFLSRGSTNIRIADVGVTAAIIIAWIISALASRDGRSVMPNAFARAGVRAVTIMVLGLAVLGANGISQWWRHLGEAYFVSGPTHALLRARQIWSGLGIPPTAFNEDEEQPRLLRIAAYVQTCTDPADRLFVLGAYPELYYFSKRLFAGGHAWLLPGYYSENVDEARILVRLRSASLPIVVTEPKTEYEDDYRPVFEQIHSYLQDEYVEAGEVDFGGARPLRVLVRAALEPVRRYEPFGLPCFTRADPPPLATTAGTSLRTTASHGLEPALMAGGPLGSLAPNLRR